MGALKLGRGTEDDVKVGPLIDEPAREKVSELVEDALDEGRDEDRRRRDPRRRAATSTRRRCSTTCPTTHASSTRRSSARSRPWACSSPRRTRSPRANDTEYGLVAYVFTRDIKRAMRVCEGLETGMVGLNQGMVSNAGAPFGGVKQSGIGREGGNEGLEEFLETKYVAVNMSGARASGRPGSSPAPRRRCCRSRRSTEPARRRGRRACTPASAAAAGSRRQS